MGRSHSSLIDTVSNFRQVVMMRALEAAALFDTLGSAGVSCAVTTKRHSRGNPVPQSHGSSVSSQSGEDLKTAELPKG